MGVFQDIISWISNKTKKNRFRYSSALNWLRWGILAIFAAAFVVGISSFVALISPYSAYGRIASNIFAPLYQWGNNLLAYFAERADSYAFYSVDVWLKSLPTLIIAIASLCSDIYIGMAKRAYLLQYYLSGWNNSGILFQVFILSSTNRSD
jgi:hypothetical protein